MYNSPQKKTARGPAHVWALRAGPVHIHGGTALQRPLELVPRQVLPDGGLGAGGISQFSPDHLWGGARHKWSAHPKPTHWPVHTPCLIALQKHPCPQTHGARKGNRPHEAWRHSDQVCMSTLTTMPAILSRSPRGCRLGSQLSSGAHRPRRGVQNTLPPERPGSAPVGHPSLLAPVRVQRNDTYWPGGSPSQADSEAAHLLEAKAAPALQAHRAEGPACTSSLSTTCAASSHQGHQQAGKPEPDMGDQGRTRPEIRDPVFCEGRSAVKIGQGSPGPSASSQPSHTARLWPHSQVRPRTPPLHQGPSPAPGSASRCTSRGRWPSPSRSGPPHSCPGAAGPSSRAPPGPAGNRSQGRGRGHQASHPEPQLPLLQTEAEDPAAGSRDQGRGETSAQVVLPRSASSPLTLVMLWTPPEGSSAPMHWGRAEHRST